MNKIIPFLLIFACSPVRAFDVIRGPQSGDFADAFVNSPTESVAQTFTSTLTVQGNAFSVGGSTLVVSGGNVGIGTTGPLSKLTVAQQITEHPDTGKYGQIEATLTNPGYRMSMGYDATLNGGFLQAIVDGASYQPIAINPRGGNVGIGTTAPQTKLDISSGTIHMAGTNTPTAGYALCLTAGGSMGHCTTQPDAGGACTCTTP